MSVVTKYMALLDGKLIVYDGRCPLSISLIDKVLGWDIFPFDKVASYYELDSNQQDKINADRFRYEMAVIDTTGGATVYGPEAVKLIFSEKWLLARLFFAIPGIMFPIRFIYRTLARNRYVVSTPRKDMPAGDWDPTSPPLYHFVYLAYSLIVALAVTLFFGAGLENYVRFTRWECAISMLLIAGTGWIMQGIIAWIFFGEKRFQYLRHMFTLMRMGVMPLLPAAILMLAMPNLHPLVPLLSVLFSSGMMLRQHYLRIWQLQASQWWTLCWFLTLQITAFAWLLNLNNIF